MRYIEEWLKLSFKFLAYSQFDCIGQEATLPNNNDSNGKNNDERSKTFQISK